MELVPVDPSSQVYKDLMAVNQANTNPGVSGTKKLIPVDPSSAEFKAIMSGQDLQQRTQPPGAPNEARVQQVQQQLAGKPRPMGATPDINIDFKTGKAKLEPPSDTGASGWMKDWGLPIAEGAFQLTPIGRASRTARAVIGGASAIGQDIIEGKTPSIGHAAMGVGASLVPEAAIQAGKWGMRTAAKAFGKGPIQEGGKAAAQEVLKRVPTVEQATEQFKNVKAMTTSLEGAGDEFGRVTKEIMKDAERTGLEKGVQNRVLQEIQDITEQRLRGKPLNYGEVFKRARDINEEAMRASTNEGRVALRKLHGAYIDDLSKVSPEAKQAVDAYRLAKRSEAVVNATASGSKEGLAKQLEKAGEIFTPEEVKNLEAIRRHVGPEWKGAFSKLATVAGLGGYLTPIPGVGPASTAGLVMSALVRMPGGMGVALARSVVSPEGTISKNVAPAIGQAVRSYIQGQQNGND